MINKLLDLYFLAVSDGMYSDMWYTYIPIFYKKLYEYECKMSHQEETDIIHFKMWIYEQCPKLMTEYVLWKKNPNMNNVLN